MQDEYAWAADIGAAKRMTAAESRNVRTLRAAEKHIRASREAAAFFELLAAEVRKVVDTYNAAVSDFDKLKPDQSLPDRLRVFRWDPAPKAEFVLSRKDHRVASEWNIDGATGGTQVAFSVDSEGATRIDINGKSFRNVGELSRQMLEDFLRQF